MKQRTKLTQLGRQARSKPGMVNLAVQRASTVTFESVADLEAVQQRFDAGEPVPTYGIVNMPLRVAFEELITQIEGGHRAVAVPSGLAAVSVAVLACAGAGDHLLMVDCAYSPGRRVCERMMKRLGIETTFFDPDIGAGVVGLMRPNTRAVYVESPGSHTFEMQDIPAIARVAHERGAAVIHDNTWATGLFYRSFEHGADLVIQAVTKYPAGHSDLLLGAVVANESAWPRLRDTARDLGQHVSPDDLFLALRGMRTLDVRLRQHQAGGLEVAHHLEKHPKVKRVLHPALPSDPGHAIWKRDYTGAAGLFGVELATESRAQMAAFVDALELFTIGYSWGGFESLVVPANIQRSRAVRPWTGGQLVRLHIGLEDPVDLIADLDRALARIS